MFKKELLDREITAGEAGHGGGPGHATSDGRARDGRGWIEGLLLGLLLCAVGWFYVWTARTEVGSWNFGRKQTDYFNLLVDGFRAGHLYMNAEVAPELLRLPDPYNPKNRPPGLGLHDASMHLGHYYLYFGAAPVVTLLLPFRLLTGTDLPLPAAVVIFTYAGFLASAATWRLLRRRYFPGTGLATDLLVLAALATASLGPVNVRRSNIWELPLGAGYCFAMLALLCLFQSLHAPRRQSWWFAGAGLALGLAVASRLPYLYATPMLLVPLAWWWRRGGRAGRWPDPAWWGCAAAGLGPLAAVGGLMALYNYARFGNPLEFGIAYQFSGIDESATRHFALRYFPFDFHAYFLTPAAWSRYFPFIHLVGQPPLPAQHLGYEAVYGVLLNLPLAWFALAAPLAVWRRAVEERGRLLVWLVAVAVLFTGVALTLCFFYAAMSRYLLDFVPGLMLLGGVGVLAGERVAGATASPWPRRVAMGVGRGALLFSVFFGLMFSFELYGNFRRQNPQAYRAVARVGDRPALWCERLAGTPHGPVELRLRFPERRTTGCEPLLVSGWLGAADRVFVQYGADGQVRLGYAHDGSEPQLSQPLALDRVAVHRLRVEMGSLYPPEASSYFDDLARSEVLQRARRLRVVWDDEILFDRYQRFYDGSPGALFIGRDPYSTSSYGREFSGKILGLERPDGAAARRTSGFAAPGLKAGAEVAPTGFDEVTMQVVFPAGRTGAREPLVVTGETGRGDFVGVEYLGERQLRFVFDHWGKPLLASPPVAVDYAVPHDLEIGLGAMPESARGDRLTIRLDGKTVWEHPAAFWPAEPEDAFFGQNPIGGTSMQPAFTGTLRDVRSVRAAAP